MIGIIAMDMITEIVKEETSDRNLGHTHPTYYFFPIVFRIYLLFWQLLGIHISAPAPTILAASPYPIYLTNKFRNCISKPAF